MRQPRSSQQTGLLAASRGRPLQRGLQRAWARVHRQQQQQQLLLRKAATAAPRRPRGRAATR